MIIKKNSYNLNIIFLYFKKLWLTHNDSTGNKLVWILNLLTHWSHQLEGLERP